jgi:hypothetical protein
LVFLAAVQPLKEGLVVVQLFIKYPGNRLCLNRNKNADNQCDVWEKFPKELAIGLVDNHDNA